MGCSEAGKESREDEWEWEGQQYLLGSCFNAFIPLTLLHIQVQSSYYVHTHQLWSNKKTGVLREGRSLVLLQ